MVQPNEEQNNFPINFWNLPQVSLDIQSSTNFTPNISKLKLGMVTNRTWVRSSGSKLLDFRRVKNIKEEIKKIKDENVNYPVLKSFRFFSDAYVKAESTEHVSPKKRKNSKRRNSKNKLHVDEDQPKLQGTQYKLWTDICKPRCSDEMISNYSNVKKIRKWLQRWLDFGCDANKNKRKRRLSDSSADFESTDIDSRDSTSVPHNTLIVCGPYGSGKTSAVHALCSEMGIVILESNAASRRTGKVLLQQLQQISQSQEVQGVVHDFLISDCDIKALPKRMHLLLIEDIDIVFDQDENFSSAVNQLISSSRIPIILTTSDLNCVQLKKYFSLHAVIKFAAVSPKVLAPWLQILCLVEGISIKKELVAELLQESNGDVRCTLLQLQFLVQSTGEAEIKSHDLKRLLNEVNDKEVSNISLIAKDENTNEILLENNIDVILGSCDISKPLELGQLWWNIPQLLNIPLPLYDESTINPIDIEDNSQNSIQKQRCSDGGREKVTIKHKSELLLEISNVLNVIAMTDFLYNGVIDCDLEPVHKNRNSNLKGSLEETSSTDSCYSNRDLTVEISHILVNGYVTYRQPFTNLKLYRGLDEKRWRAKQYKCEENLLEGVPLTHHLNRMALTDFLSTLRAISKSESNRLCTNNKRKNRFYHYLTGLGISFNDSILKTADNAFFSGS